MRPTKTRLAFGLLGAIAFGAGPAAFAVPAPMDRLAQTVVPDATAPKPATPPTDGVGPNGPAADGMAPGGVQTPPATSDAAPQPPAPAPETVMLPDRPVLFVTGTATWEEAEKELGHSFEEIFAAIKEAGLTQAGPPMVEYTESDDDSFGFKAMVPITTEAGANLPEEIERGRSPAGQALKFVHKGSFDGLEAVYNRIFDYLSAKNLQVMRVVEEYPSDPATTPADKMTTIIYVFAGTP